VNPQEGPFDRLSIQEAAGKIIITQEKVKQTISHRILEPHAAAECMAGHVQHTIFDVRILILHVFLAVKNVSQDQKDSWQRYRPSLQHFLSLVGSIVTFDSRMEIASKRTAKQSRQRSKKSRAKRLNL
jgi:hypothetical protein